MKKLWNWGLFFIVVLIWSANWPVMKSALNYVDPLSFSFHRYLIASIILFPLLLYHHSRIPKDRRNLSKLIFFGIISMMGLLSANLGLAYETSGISAVITYTQPLFVFCLAWPVLGEKPKKNRISGVLIGFLGVMVISFRDKILQGNLIQIFLLLAGAFFWAVSIVFYKKYVSQIEIVIANSFQICTGGFLLGLLALLSGHTLFPRSINYLPLILYASIPGTVIALTIWYYLLKEEEATVLSSSSLIIPMVAILFGWLLLGESVDFKSFIGSCLIIIGVYIVNRKT